MVDLADHRPAAPAHRRLDARREPVRRADPGHRAHPRVVRVDPQPGGELEEPAWGPATRRGEPEQLVGVTLEPGQGPRPEQGQAEGLRCAVAGGVEQEQVRSRARASG